jgi:tetratricopeptide (TPR) repeat protein
MNKLFFIFAILLPFFSLAENADLNQARDLFEKGTEAYKAGDYESALTYFAEAESKSTGFAVNYNLGNTHFKLNNIKESILYYERALKYEPANEDVIYNLRLANDLIVDRIENLPKSKLNRWWRDFRYGMGPDGWGLIAIALAIAASVLLLIYSFRFRPGVRRFGFYGGLIAIGLMICAITLAQSAKNFRVNNISGVIFTDKVDVKSEPRTESLDILVLHAGTKVDIIDQEGDWYEIQIASGDRGWLKAETIEEI